MRDKGKEFGNAWGAIPEQIHVETLHPELAAKMTILQDSKIACEAKPNTQRASHRTWRVNFAYASFARTRLSPPSVRAFSK